MTQIFSGRLFDTWVGKSMMGLVGYRPIVIFFFFIRLLGGITLPNRTQLSNWI
jgi:hypothetical protein